MALLRVLGKTTHPDFAFARFDPEGGGRPVVVVANLGRGDDAVGQRRLPQITVPGAQPVRLVRGEGDRRVQAERVCIDHVEEHTVRLALDNGFWCGMTLYPKFV